MSITLEQATAAVSQSGMRATASADQETHAKQVQFAVNHLLIAGVPWGDLFGKAMQIIAIVTGPGDWPTKIAAIFALFKKTVPDNINLP